MLQALREKTSGWIAFLILGAVMIPFAFFGINNYFETRVDTWVARIGDDEITPAEFRARWDEYREQLRAQMGEAYDPRYFEQATVKRQFLDRLVDERVLLAAATELGTQASDELLREQIASIPAFQSEGRFDETQYQLQLARTGMNVPIFEERMRRDLSARELPSQVAATALVTDDAVDRYLRLRDQVRDVRWAWVPPQPAEDYVPDDTAIQAYYDEHRDEFLSQEQVSLEYVELKAEALPVEVTPDEAMLKQRFDEQRSRFVVEEQRLSSHILVQVDAGADAEAQRAASEKAQSLAERARAGEDFAALAREASDDIGSRASGGDLGWIERGMTAPAFETALFELEAGAISDPVRTDEGYHVIALREVQAERAKSFDEVREELATEYLESERERAFSDRAGELVDLVFQNPDSLAPAAQALELEVQRTGLFGRQGGEGIAAHPAVLEAAFSDLVLVEGTASDAIEIGPNHLVVIRVDEHRASTPLPLAEVRERLVARMRFEEQQRRTRALAERLRGRLDEGASMEALAAEAGVTLESAAAVTRTAPNLDRGLVERLFELPRPGETPVHAVVELDPGPRFALVEVAGVVDGDAAAVDAAGREAARQTLAQAAAQAEYAAFLDAQRRKFEIRVAEERL